MPKTAIDYSNTIIYKITCKDEQIHDVYVGHTTNFVQIKDYHQHTCTNTTSDSYNCKLYEVIRNNGGWDNWKMEIVDFFNCKDIYEAIQKEQEYFISLNATLNSVEPLSHRPHQPESITFNISEKTENDTTITKHRFFCKTCDFKCGKQSNYNTHISTNKHKRLMNEIKNPKKYQITCSNCDKECSQNAKKNQNTCPYCNKRYVHRSGLCRHKKICTKMTSKATANNTDNITHDVYDKLIGILEIIKNKNNSVSGLQNRIINTTNCKKEMMIFTGDNITIHSHIDNNSHNNNNNNNNNNNHNNNNNNNNNNTEN